MFFHEKRLTNFIFSYIILIKATQTGIHMSNIETIAKEAEVSIATVSRALRSPAKSQSDSQRRIVNIAKKLGYDFNKRKKRTLSKKTKQIVFLSFSKNLSPEALHADGTYLPIVNGINKVIEKEGFNLIVSDVGIDENPPPSLLRNDVDGVIFHGTMSNNFYDKYIKHLPHVGIQHHDPLLKCNWVLADYWSVSFQAVEYLYKLGHRKIAFMSDMAENYNAQERYRGYKEALKYFNLPFNEDLVQCWQRPQINGIIPLETQLPDYTPQVSALMNCKTPPSAIICLGDFRAMATLEALKKMNLSVPDDVSVIGASNEIGQSFFTGCSGNFSSICSYAAQFLMELINGKHIKLMKVMIQPTLCIGNSTKDINSK